MNNKIVYLNLKKKESMTTSPKPQNNLVALDMIKSQKWNEELLGHGMYVDEKGCARMIYENKIRENILASKEQLTKIIGSDDVF